MAQPRVIVVTEEEELQLTTELGQDPRSRTCVYVSCINGKLVFAGGASIIERIKGEGMKEKVI